MKEYQKEYEDVFTAERNLKKCKIEKVGVRNDEMLPEEYQFLFRETIDDFHEIIFDYLVKIIWLSKRFKYDGHVKTKVGFNGPYIARPYCVFSRWFLNHDTKFMTSSQYMKIISYFDDLFPDFDKDNPFNTKYEYPYKFMNLDCMFLVYRIPERLELLKTGEERQMNYCKFVDYVINHILCWNADEENKDSTYIYQLNAKSRVSPYVNVIRRDGTTENKKKKYEGRTKKRKSKKT